MLRPPLHLLSIASLLKTFLGILHGVWTNETENGNKAIWNNIEILAFGVVGKEAKAIWLSGIVVISCWKDKFIPVGRSAFLGSLVGLSNLPF